MRELVLAQLRSDALAGRFAHWGTSTLIDEFTGVPMIPSELFAELHRAAGIECEFPVGNAGVLHVYGYWFSEVPTPFGLKRDRWERGELALALGLRREEFLLQHSSGRTLLERVNAALLPLLRVPDPAVQLAEVCVAGRVCRVVLVRRPQEGAAALIYGIARRAAEFVGGADRVDPGELNLVTAFPFSGDSGELLADFVADPRFRWNAVSH